MLKECGIVFDLDNNDDESITVYSEYPISIVDFTDFSEIFFMSKKKKIRLLLIEETTRYCLDLFEINLKKALSNQLQLDPSIKKNLGYLHNESSKNYLLYQFRDSSMWTKEVVSNEYIFIKHPELVYEIDKGTHYWVGEKYIIWDSKIDTWLYNDQEGNIILELTPVYPGHFISEPKKTSFIVYEEWIKTYKPILKRVIPQEVAKRWLEDAQKVLNVIEKNTQEYCATQCDESLHYYLKEK